MPAARYVQARQYASIFRSSSLVTRSAVETVLASAAVGCTCVISSAMSSPPLLEPRPAWTGSPCDHSFPLHHCEPRDQSVRVVVTADTQEVVQTAVPHVATDERLKARPALDHPDEVPVEVSPARLSPPALGLAEPKMDIRRDTDETEHSRVQTELFLEDARAVREQRVLDRFARQPVAAGKLESREQRRCRQRLVI